ncbi:glycerate kinase [Dorea longicatena]|jgi:glycerate 2-kinase|uniref:Glycerate kinase n=1 Tax=Dorea longicatena TaxID=88431 RepID=A0A414SPQ6_9FIRM|nr:glycerate kinase [Dorea longicatena]RHG07186.1 glycerate kinase [Dorea longicatena]RHG22291.1 glycerate kinase [Dorea longicatena]
MKVVIAIDSLKGSLSSMEAGTAIKDGILAAKPDAEVIVKPLADGGEGTTDALIEGMNGERIDLTVTGPMHTPVDAYYGYLKDTNTAVMEMASAAGITLVPDSEKNPLLATSYGVGEMINDAIQRGCRNFIIGIGGSVTNDGGIGMLKALGVRFLDENGEDAGEGGQALAKVARIDVSGMNPLLKECHIQVACDVNNPLCGENGSTYVYGPQKGVTEDMKKTLDEAMAHFARVTSETLENDYMNTPGAGAAGGLGYAFLAYTGAALTPGIELILDAVGLEEELSGADVVVTGEGRLDFQTAMGKAPVGVARLAKKYNAKVIAFAGSVTKEATACNKEGIDAFFPILRSVCTLAEAMDPVAARNNMTATVEQVFRLL